MPRQSITPNEGEFKRVLNETCLPRTRAASRRTIALIVLKGSDTVSAASGSRAIINASAPPTLATAGSRNVLWHRARPHLRRLYRIAACTRKNSCDNPIFRDLLAIGITLR
jgi:hypothetical protein